MTPKKTLGDFIPIPTLVVTGAGVLILTIAGWVWGAVDAATSKRAEREETNTTTLVSHEVKIGSLEKYDDTVDERFERLEIKVDARLERMELKIDRLLDAARNK